MVSVHIGLFLYWYSSKINPVIDIYINQLHKHLGMMLDSNLGYEHHIKSILNKVKKQMFFSLSFSQYFQDIP